MSDLNINLRQVGESTSMMNIINPHVSVLQIINGNDAEPGTLRN